MSTRAPVIAGHTDAVLLEWRQFQIEEIARVFSGHTPASLAPLRAVRTAIPAAHAGTEPAGAVMPGQAAPAPTGSDHPHRFLKLARAE